MRRIRVEGLTKRYGSFLALDAVNLEIEPGELFFLLGPSGCGKTTLLRHLAGFIRPDSGRIWFDQENVTHWPPHLRETALMFQSYALWPHLDVFENVAFGLRERHPPESEIRARVLDALAMVQLEKLIKRPVGSLSGGQQQRIALARALVVRPRCLLLDEPLSNLDPMLRLEMRVEIRRICKDYGVTAVYVTHDQHEALSMADRIAVMGQGRILQLDTPERIYRQPLNREVASFIGEANYLKARVIALENQEEKLQLELNSGQKVSCAVCHSLNIEPGAWVELLLRPESVRLSRNSSEEIEFDAELMEVLYLGRQVLYRVKLKEGENLQISVQNPSMPLKTPGMSFKVWVDPQDLTVLSA